MISRTGKENFFTRHYDWIVAGVGLVALLGAAGYFASTLGADADAAATEALNHLKMRTSGSETGVVKPDLTPFTAATRQVRTPTLVTEVSDRQESFLASESRVRCTCGKAIPGGLAACPFCQKSLVVVNKVDEEARKREQWTKRFGVEIDELDKDDDGFTNREEYMAKTDPTDAKDHPDYLDSLQLQLPLQETFVPFFLLNAEKIPAGWRCEFCDPKLKDDYGRLGRTFKTMVGEEIILTITSATGASTSKPTGYRLKSVKIQQETRAIAGTDGKTHTVDIPVATVERRTDSKAVELKMQPTKKSAQLSAVDVQATLLYTRGGTKTFNVITGAEVDLNGTKYKVTAIKAVGKGAEITLENQITGKKRVLKALE